MSDTSDRQYVVHGRPISLFTRKLEAGLDFYGVPYRSELKSTRDAGELEARAGTHQIPVLTTPENWALADTTPIMAMLDGLFPRRRMFPEGLAGLLVHVAEEVLDEWVARVMVHYRWHYPVNTRDVLATSFGVELDLEEVMKHPVAQWGPRACRATGTELVEHQQAAEAEYIGMLEVLEAQLGQTPFALGDRPTAVDCMLLGGLRAHTNQDPYPDLTRFSRVLAWNKQPGADWSGAGALPPFPETTPFAEHLLALARDHYAPFLLGNAQALATGAKAFVIDTYGTPCSYLARPYPEQSRRMIEARIRDHLSEAEQKEARTWLEAWGLAESFWPESL